MASFQMPNFVVLFIIVYITIQSSALSVEGHLAPRRLLEAAFDGIAHIFGGFGIKPPPTGGAVPPIKLTPSFL